MTDTATAPAGATLERPGAQAVAKATEIAGELLAKGRRQADPQTAAAFGRALAATSPKSPHRHLLIAALQPRPVAGRSPAERAAYWLACRGETPTPQAVAARLEVLRARCEGIEQRQARVEQLADRDASRAADHVGQVLAETGAGPTWSELAAAMGWPVDVKNAVIRRLVLAGWLEIGEDPRSMRPGRAAQTGGTEHDQRAV